MAGLTDAVLTLYGGSQVAGEDLKRLVLRARDVKVSLQNLKSHTAAERLSNSAPLLARLILTCLKKTRWLVHASGWLCGQAARSFGN